MGPLLKFGSPRIVKPGNLKVMVMLNLQKQKQRMLLSNWPVLKSLGVQFESTTPMIVVPVADLVDLVEEAEVTK